MNLNKVLKHVKLIGVASIKVDFLIFAEIVFSFVLSHKFWGHGDTDLDTLHPGEVALVGEVDPALLIELRPDIKLKIFDLVVLPHQSGRQAKLAMTLRLREEGPLKHLGGRHLDFVQDEEAPLHFS